MVTVLLARQLLTPLERIDDAALVIEDGVVSAVVARQDFVLPANARVIDFGDAILTPGLIDIHIHGGAGHDVMEASEAGRAALERQLVTHGVTSYCPTTITAPMNETLTALEKLGEAVRSANNEVHADRARPLGIHLEGPFLSHSRPGVHAPVYLQPPSTRVFEPMWDAAGGSIGMMTIAPELPGALELIAKATLLGVRVSVGHTNASLDEASAGIAAGARHATHTFNAMRRMEHRDPGVLGVVLTNDSLTADIIVDGLHVEPVIVDLFVRAKGLERAVLITDAISAAGMPDGVYRLGSFEVQVRDGRCEAHGKLAGSVLTLDRAVRNLMKFARRSFQDSVRLATLNPACVLGIEDRKGMLRPGADADIAVFSPAGEVQRTIIGGLV